MYIKISWFTHSLHSRIDAVIFFSVIAAFYSAWRNSVLNLNTMHFDKFIHVMVYDAILSESQILSESLSIGHCGQQSCECVAIHMHIDGFY